MSQCGTVVREADSPVTRFDAARGGDAVAEEIGDIPRLVKERLAVTGA
jgi:hypothetical protein